MIQLLLEREGYSRIDTATNRQQARELIDQNAYDLIVLDVMLPDGSGFDLCQEIRKTSKIPILFRTSRTADIDILAGFGYGGDDYVTKPFHALELVARIKALLRRYRYFQEQLEQQQPEVLDYGDLIHLSKGVYEEPLLRKGLLSRFRKSQPKKHFLFFFFGDLFDHMEQLTERLRTSEEERKRLEKQRQDWIAGISHDLKTPLAYIKGYASMMSVSRYR